MIPIAAITEWRHVAPWSQSHQVEHDLLLSRMLVDIFNHPLLQEKLAFRGGTALHKLYLSKNVRFSEDIDLVQTAAEPIGEVMSAIHEVFNKWLGQPKVKQNEGRVVMIYQVAAEEDKRPIKIKIEINTREHLSYLGFIYVPFVVQSRWFHGDTKIRTYYLEELMATKLRALYQRKKGRDLFDFFAVLAEEHQMDLDRLVSCFQDYIEASGLKISRAEFEMNLSKKQKSTMFNADMTQLLPEDIKQDYDHAKAYEYLFESILPKLPGEAWKGLTAQQDSTKR